MDSSIDEEQEARLLEDVPIEAFRPPQKSSKSSQAVYVLAIIGYLLSALLLTASILYPLDRQCIQTLSTWSPMLQAVEYEQRPLANLGSASKYMGKPTPEIEEAWFNLWAYGATGISESDLPKLNKSMDSANWTMLPNELGGGVKAFFEGFHQLHCLDLIRQYTYRDQYDYGDLPAWDQSAAMRLNHVEHCIEILRIVLVCAADATPYPISIDHEGRESVHTNVNYQCRKWDKLVTWAEATIVEPYNATEEKIKHHTEHINNS